ncbi:phosphatidylinositol-specific phospholipase C domain-containing protein [Bacillus cereus group sp. BfR-BA-01354]|uniref:phosphatidylinositol-specific phospholipase C domain-containing protein n=1 Tax=Bacillus cereus group TaxID=86661 RepID=UPI001F56EF82
MENYRDKRNFIDSSSIRSSFPNFLDDSGQLAIDRNGFNVNQTIDYINRDWMNYIPDSLRISELSIPGTHGSMALYGGVAGGLGDIAINQTMNLTAQLDSGIRYFDIRCRHYFNNFSIHHGQIYQHAYFGPDVLDHMINFLHENPSETILMRVKEEYNPAGNTRTFGQTFESFWSPNQHVFWNPTSSNPTLGEVRGRIILLQNFSAYRSFGISWGALNVQDEYEILGENRLYLKWEKVRNHFFHAMQNRNQIHVNHLSGTGGFNLPRPWFVASGFINRRNDSLPKRAYGEYTSIFPAWPWRDNPRYITGTYPNPIFYGGTNVLSTRRIRDGRFTHTGIVAADFPGEGLIAGTIALNFPGTLSGDFQIVTALNNSSVLELHGPTNIQDRNVTPWSNNYGDHQRWNFRYIPSKNAYIIESVSNPGLVLAWNVPNPDRKVFATPFVRALDEHYWISEKFGHWYVFRNKKDPNMVLTAFSSSNGANLYMSPNYGRSSQMFSIRFI